MRTDQVDTLIDQLEDYVKALIKDSSSNDVADSIVLKNMRESLKEYICSLAGIQTKNIEEFECPECGSKMKQRTNRQTGNNFYGCVKFTDCKGTRDEDGLSKSERAAKKDVTQQDGFSFKKREPWNESGPS